MVVVTLKEQVNIANDIINVIVTPKKQTKLGTGVTSPSPATVFSKWPTVMVLPCQRVCQTYK